MQVEVKRVGKTIPHFLGRVIRALPCCLAIIAYAIEIAVVAFLFILSIVFTPIFLRVGEGYGPIHLSENQDYHFGTPSTMFVVGFLMLFLFFLMSSVILARVRGHWMLSVLLIYAFLVQVLWIASLSMISYMYPDSVSLSNAAVALLQGDDDCRQYAVGVDACMSEEAFSQSQQYFSWYPFQAGPLMWYMIIFHIFGSRNVIAFQVVNACFITVFIAVLWRFGTHIGLRNEGRAAFASLSATCMPLMMFAAFVYPNAIGLTIVMSGLLLAAEAFSMKHAWSSVLALVSAFVLCGVGMVFKTTFQILVIAGVIASLFAIWKSRRYWQLPVVLAAVFVAKRILDWPTQWLERVTGLDFGKGMPMSAWIAIGLGQPKNMPAGWWSPEMLQMFMRVDGDYSKQSEIAMGTVRQRLTDMLNNPAAGRQFFVHKLASEWAEPTFMTSLYSELGESSINQNAGISSEVLHGSLTIPLLRYQNVSQSLIYFLALIGIAVLIRKIHREKTQSMDPAEIFSSVLLSTSFIGGFLCYVFWEAKGIYTLPFYLMLLPFAALGLQQSSNMLSGLSRRILKKSALDKLRNGIFVKD